jgi:hypothetical protein
VNARAVASLLLLAALTGCATPAVLVISPAYDGTKVKRVTLVGFTDYPGAPGSGEIVSSTFEKHLLSVGYRLIARGPNMGTLQGDFSTPGGVTQDELTTAGHALGVDALVFGTLSDYTNPTDQTVMVDMPVEQMDPVYGHVTTTERKGDTRVRSDRDVVTGYATTTTMTSVPQEQTTPAHVAFTAELMDADGGELLWSVSTAGTGDDLGAAAEDASQKAVKALAAQLKKLAK